MLPCGQLCRQREPCRRLGTIYKAEDERERGPTVTAASVSGWMPPDAHTGPVAQDGLGDRMGALRTPSMEMPEVLEGQASGVKTLIHLPKAETHSQLRAGQG